MSEEQRAYNLGIDPELISRDPLEYERRLRAVRERLERSLVHDDGLEGTPPESVDQPRPPMHLSWYWPKEECDLVVRIDQDGTNLCSTLALALHQIADQECKRLGKPRTVYRPNLVYEFDCGLVFRLFRAQSEDEPVLEFLAPARPDRSTTAILLEIPPLLAQAGMNDGRLLTRLRKVIQHHEPSARCEIA